MLAIQRPRMGSSQPPDGAGPFGYSFTTDDNLFLQPPEPAPGEPLLSYEDDRALHTFFDQIQSNQYGGIAFGEGLTFSDSWHDLPPQFMGSATSYGHQPAQPSMSIEFTDPDDFHDVFHFASSSLMAPPPPPPQRHAPHPPLHSPLDHGTPADAAAVLTALHNGHPGRPSSINHGHILSQPMGPPPPSLQHRSHFHPERSGPMHTVPIPTTVGHMPEPRGGDHMFSDMTFASPHVHSNQRAVQIPEDVQWGSDTSFGRGHSFIPASERETAPALENERIKYIECLQLSNSTSNTRPSSPAVNGESSADGMRNGHMNGVGRKDPEVLPRKRRKSKANEDATPDDDVDDSTTAPAKAAAARKRKSKLDLGKAEDMSLVDDTPGKRRKSNANGAKPPRENLSEEQKRSNHIRSEQKRRTLIKEGFDDLQEIVPNLRNGGYSKSSMLQLAGEWLDNMLKENELLSS
ncbi:uncharacterized protein PG998_009671 [Apiospora kogelbergensis]|uniref:uncharacterized protein n=1 Tax=Apiospora kogelbergensis TaxID=1337665 RepID=UPI00312F9798